MRFEIVMNDTKAKILDVAERLTQTKGFNGFSYLDLADAVGIKHSGVHYHFKAKSDLALALVERIHDVHLSAFAELETSLDTPEERLSAMISFFQAYIKEEKYCLCGMMSAELQSVSPAVRQRLIAYFGDFQGWLKRQFEAMGHGDSKVRALRFISALEGSLLLARLENDPAIVSRALEGFTKKH